MESEIKKGKTVYTFFFVVLSMAFSFGTFWALLGQECSESTLTFTETFNTTNYQDEDNYSIANWGNGYVTLNWLGANFEVTEPIGMGAKIYVCGAGDFDGDGLPDLIGLDIENNYRLILARNHFEDLDGNGEDDDGIIFQTDENEVYDQGLTCGPASISVGDYNNDGLLDFFVLKNGADAFSYSNFLAVMYINCGSASNPNFYNYMSSPNLNFSSRFMETQIYINWAADHLDSVDIDNDNDIDILVVSQDKIFLLRNPGPNNFDLDSFEISELSYDEKTGFSSGRGGSSIDAGDFDNDNDIDLIAGTVNDFPYLAFYENDGMGYFNRSEIPIPNPDCTGTVATCIGDFDLDGQVDIFGATDRWNAGNEARMWLFNNRGMQIPEGGGEDDAELSFEFRCLNNGQPILPEPHDVDMSAMLDFDQDGDLDIVLADANHSGNYYLIINQMAPVYSLTGEARSSSLSEELNPDRMAITKVRINHLDQDIIGGSSQGLAIEYYFSNNGVNWEFYTRFDESGIHYTSDFDWLPFSHFGSTLMWKAVLTAAEDEMEEYSNASFETPVIREISLEYAYIEKKEYSRTSLAATRVKDENDQIKKLIVAGTFYFPGWEGHLRAYDVTNMGPEDTTYSELSTVSRPDSMDPSGREIIADGVSVLWDAGELLNFRAAGDRNIYTAHYVDEALSRIVFTTANVDVLSEFLMDVNNENEELIDFVRGENHLWKLGDINHSNPIAVGPPNGISGLKGEGYEEFKQTWANRPSVIFVGANDGMLHCFDALTGEEIWGFIPFNLLPKLTNMWAVDPDSPDRYFFRDVYVDGTPSVADVCIDADGNGTKEWITIIVCGQGAGQGSTIGGGTTGNFYFALNVTDPENPQPLWEFTHIRMGETWSVPAIGKINKEGQDTWVAFMGSGYDNVEGEGRQGHRFFAVTLENGAMFWGFNVSEENTEERWTNGKNIKRSIPGSPAIVDIDRNGYDDCVYVGDLEGRLWKVDISSSWYDTNSWQKEKIYEDSNNYPIISKPAVWLNTFSSGIIPRLYFGTGGDDKAPADTIYSFVALLDNYDHEVEWFLGDPDILGLPEEKDIGDLSLGEKIWADPKIGDFVVYFSTLTGSIESVDPCENLAGIGRLYARNILPLNGSKRGSTVLTSSFGPKESLNLGIKTRSAVTLGETEMTHGVRKREVYIQEYDSSIQRLEQLVGSNLIIKSWREVHRVIR